MKNLTGIYWQGFGSDYKGVHDQYLPIFKYIDGEEIPKGFPSLSTVYEFYEWLESYFGTELYNWLITCEKIEIGDYSTVSGSAEAA